MIRYHHLLSRITEKELKYKKVKKNSCFLKLKTVIHEDLHDSGFAIKSPICNIGSKIAMIREKT